MQLLGKFKKILYMGFRATLNFRKFKVALNPMYRIFLNFPKSCILSCFQNAIIRKLLNAIETELEGSGNSIGYRQMHQRLSRRRPYEL